MTDTTVSDSSAKIPEYADFKLAVRTLTHCHVRVTHPEDFIQHAGELLDRVNRRPWVYTGDGDTGWTPIGVYLKRSSDVPDWKPIGPIGLSEALKLACQKLMSRNDQCFFFVPNGDLLFSDPVNAANFTSLAQHVLGHDKYLPVFISYGYGPSSPHVRSMMCDVDERAGQAYLGVQDAKVQMAAFGIHGTFTADEGQRFAPQFQGMTRLQVWRITNEMVVRVRKIEGRKLDFKHLLDFRASIGLPYIEPEPVADQP